MFKYWPLLLVGFFLTILAGALSISMPWIHKILIDDISEGGSVDKLRTIVLALVGIALLRVGSGILKARIFAQTQESAVKDLRETFMNHILRLRLRNSSDYNTGSVVSITMLDIEKIGGLFGSIIADLITDVFKFIALTGLMIYLSWKLSIIVLPLFILLVILMKDATKPIQRASTNVQDSKARVSAMIADCWDSNAETKTLNARHLLMSRLSGVFNNLRTSSVKLATIIALLQSGEVYIWLVGATMLYVGGKDVINGTMTMGSLIAFWSYMGMILGPMDNFLGSLGTARTCLGASERVFGILDADDVEDSTAGSDFPVDFNYMRFSNLEFFYTDGEPLFRGLNAKIKRGEKVAIIGSSGSGKSSIAALLTNLYSPVGGSIYFDDIDIRNIRIDSLRRHVGLVFQNPHIYQASVLDNISIACPEASTDRIQKAAKLALIHDFVLSLPDGYSTLIGDGYRELSGGQKQRIALARMFLRAPSVLILDEATSALDRETEKRVVSNLLEHFAKATIVVITHGSLAMIEFDQVIDIEKNRVLPPEG